MLFNLASFSIVTSWSDSICSMIVSIIVKHCGDPYLNNTAYYHWVVWVFSAGISMTTKLFIVGIALLTNVFQILLGNPLLLLLLLYSGILDTMILINSESSRIL